jgi:hypothetical protein
VALRDAVDDSTNRRYSVYSGHAVIDPNRSILDPLRHRQERHRLLPYANVVHGSAQSLVLGEAMRRRDFILASGATVAWPLAGRAQQPTKPVVGLLLEVPWVESTRAAFRRGMADVGYVMEYRIQPDSLTQAAADLVRFNVNVIFAAAPAALPPLVTPRPASLSSG